MGYVTGLVVIRIGSFVIRICGCAGCVNGICDCAVCVNSIKEPRTLNFFAHVTMFTASPS
jgi:hypothetical protein